jgi:phytoene synthase
MRARFAVEAAARLYRGILNTVRKNGYQVFTQKQFVSNEDKRSILGDVEAEQP